MDRTRMDRDPLEITVTLSNRQDAIPRRRFTLSSSKPSMLLGRSSRRHGAQRGLPAADNGLFHSPIVSRKHATLSLRNENDGVVVIQDAGSLHGTSINNKRLDDNETKVLKNGDYITLGSRIIHNDEEISPRTFKVDLERHGRMKSVELVETWNSKLATPRANNELQSSAKIASPDSKNTTPKSNTFSVPDASDSDYSYSDVELDDDELEIVAEISKTTKQIKSQAADQPAEKETNVNMHMPVVAEEARNAHSKTSQSKQPARRNHTPYSLSDFESDYEVEEEEEIREGKLDKDDGGGGGVNSRVEFDEHSNSDEEFVNDITSIVGAPDFPSHPTLQDVRVEYENRLKPRELLDWCPPTKVSDNTCFIDLTEEKVGVNLTGNNGRSSPQIRDFFETGKLGRDEDELPNDKPSASEQVLAANDIVQKPTLPKDAAYGHGSKDSFERLSDESEICTHISVGNTVGCGHSQSFQCSECRTKTIETRKASLADKRDGQAPEPLSTTAMPPPWRSYSPSSPQHRPTSPKYRPALYEWEAIPQSASLSPFTYPWLSSKAHGPRASEYHPYFPRNGVNKDPYPSYRDIPTYETASASVPDYSVGMKHIPPLPRKPESSSHTAEYRASCMSVSKNTPEPIVASAASRITIPNLVNSAEQQAPLEISKGTKRKAEQHDTNTDAVSVNVPDVPTVLYERGQSPQYLPDSPRLTHEAIQDNEATIADDGFDLPLNPLDDPSKTDGQETQPTDNLSEPISANAETVSQAIIDEPPQKRARLETTEEPTKIEKKKKERKKKKHKKSFASTAGTFLAGALVGGVGIFGALATLPDSFF